MHPDIKAAFPKSGVSTSIASAARNTRNSDICSGILALFRYQQVPRTTEIVEHCFRNILIRTCIECLTLNTCLHDPLWEITFNSYSKWVSKHSLICFVCKYNHVNNINIIISYTELSPKRHNDQSIIAMAVSRFSELTDLKSINRVRIYHSVINISDVCTANCCYLNGSFLQKDQNTGKRNQICSQ